MKTSVLVAFATAAILACNDVGAATSDASPAHIQRKDFIRAYVRCNNEAWSGVSHALIPYRGSALEHAKPGEPEVAGFFRLGYLSPRAHA